MTERQNVFRRAVLREVRRRAEDSVADGIGLTSVIVAVSAAVGIGLDVILPAGGRADNTGVV